MHGCFLRFLNVLGGLPVRPCGGNGCVVPNTSSGWKVALVMAGQLACPVVALGCFVTLGYVSEFRITDLYYSLRKTGLNVTDVTAVFAFFIFSTASIVPAFFLFIRKRTDLEVLCARSMLDCGLPNLERQRIDRAEATVAAVIFAIHVLGCIVGFFPGEAFFTLTGYFAPDSVIPPSMAFVFVLTITSITFSPFFVSLFAVTSGVLSYTAHSIKTWAKSENITLDKLGEDFFDRVWAVEAPKKKKSSQSEADVLIRLEVEARSGERLVVLIDEVNCTLGGLILVQIARQVLMAICYWLFISSVYIVFMDSFRGLVFYYAMYVGSSAVMIVAPLSTCAWMTKHGQDILNNLVLARRRCQRLLVSNADWLPSSMSTRLSVLADNLDRCPGVEPMHFFVLGNASILSLSGLVATYFFVLFQFQITEGTGAFEFNSTLSNSSQSA